MNREPRSEPLAIWGGIECTVNRVDSTYFDQIQRSGHDRRRDDLARIASLGIRTLRYPLLWERTAPNGIAYADWTFSDDRIAELQRLDIRPFVGLLHHGSGPRETNLLDPQFAQKLAQYACAVAERYPALDMYTPINEPLTTARFSALYGHWYPHASDDRSFIRALLLECHGVALAMRAIRAINPSAKLVQTEDVGASRAASRLSYQVAFERERRWLTMGLLTGRVDRNHPLWRWLRRGELEARILDDLRELPCAPDIIGINYYVTSERSLDDRVEYYPQESVGGNGRDRYVDVEAVRVCEAGLLGCRSVIDETWERYRIPVAITEAHMGCTREEQLRWIFELWTDACAARTAGADVRALTIWSLLGAFDWRSLVTRDEGHYEPGAFDVRGAEPRETAVGQLVRELVRGEIPTHPVLAEAGWWRRPDRFFNRIPAAKRAA